MRASVSMTEPDRDGDQLSIPHATPEAFRQALTARIASTARSDALRIAELRRQFAYSRFLYRVFASGDSIWVLKGATGLLARIPSRARHSLGSDRVGTARDRVRCAVSHRWSGNPANRATHQGTPWHQSSTIYPQELRTSASAMIRSTRSAVSSTCASCSIDSA